MPNKEWLAAAVWPKPNNPPPLNIPGREEASSEPDIPKLSIYSDCLCLSPWPPNTPSSNPGNSGWTIVWNSTLSPTSVGYYEWDITDFAYSGGGLALCFAWGQCPYGWTADGQARTFSDSGDAYAWMSRSDGSGYYTNASSANSNYNSYVQVIELYF